VRGATAALVYSSLHRGSVILPGAEVTVLTIPAGDVAAAFWRQAQDGRVATRVCYCSLYDDCWIADSEADEPAPVRRCPADAASEFRQ